MAEVRSSMRWIFSPPCWMIAMTTSSRGRPRSGSEIVDILAFEAPNAPLLMTSTSSALFSRKSLGPLCGEAPQQRNFGLTARQVTRILLRLKDTPTHTLNFFIWAAQQRGYCPTAACFKILKDTVDVYIDDVHLWLQDMDLNGYHVPVNVCTLLMEVFAEKNMVQQALEVFQSMTKFCSRPDEDEYNVILQILMDADRIDAAMEIFEQMMKDKWCRPGDTAFSLILWGLGKVGKIADARKLLGSLKQNSSIATAKAHSQFVDGLCEGGWMDQAEEAVIEMYEHGIKLGVDVYMSLISGHKKAGRLTEANRFYLEAVQDGLIKPSSGTIV